ncbi:S8 family serine peptidase [Streptomyces sp. NPDC088354]|uniref:S53 family peptidase n=1 Tax=unclassified Streptomyces TaxID=2593676 RepID=UPI0029BEF745|nr:S53 family peptidase [Streptomyces sp. MI02-7b]MDX3073258.1 S53 family peptidase [Streptomyces sp. MI02-7b]
MRRIHARRRTAVAAAWITSLTSFATAATLLSGSAAVAAPVPPAQGAKPAPAAGQQSKSAAHNLMTTAECRAKWRIGCYSATQYRQAYDLNPLYRAGITGKGRTIVIVDPFGSPTVQKDLDVYSARFGMKSTHVDVVKWGKVPRFDPTDADQLAWAGETTLDVEMAHAVAPDAHIVLAETAVGGIGEGTTGLREVMDAEKSLIDRGVGDVISQSWGVAENSFPGFRQGDFSSIENLRYAFKDAHRHGVTVVAASGDSGATDTTPNGKDHYPYRVNAWPTADPLVVSVGGTQLHLDAKGDRIAPDSVYNDAGAGGGGLSHVFARPSYQNGVAQVGGHRGTPDLSMSASLKGGAWVYSSYDPKRVGWDVYVGTSEASPLFAGIVALADQAAGHRLGDIHQALYSLYAQSSRNPSTGIVDVKDGTNNSFAGVPGYTAAKGYDLATGVGTIDAARFVPALAQRG